MRPADELCQGRTIMENELHQVGASEIQQRDDIFQKYPFRPVSRMSFAY